jgi:hypothetical protein
VLLLPPREAKVTNEERKLEFIGSTYSLIYNTKVSFYIEPPRSPGSKRNLVTQYENGRAELVYAIADNQSKEEILRNVLLQYPLNTSGVGAAALYRPWSDIY